MTGQLGLGLHGAARADHSVYAYFTAVCIMVRTVQNMLQKWILGVQFSMLRFF